MKTRLIPLLLVAATGCSSSGTARDFDPEELAASSGWVAIRDVPVLLQKTEPGCGIAALAMVFEYWKMEGWTRDRIEATCPILQDRGTRARDLRTCARRAGLEAHLIHGTWEDLHRELLQGRPMIVGLVKLAASGPITHYELLVGLHPERRLVLTLDPAYGWRQNSWEGFLTEWEATTGLLLVFARNGSAPPAGSP